MKPPTENGWHESWKDQIHCNKYFALKYGLQSLVAFKTHFLECSEFSIYIYIISHIKWAFSILYIFHNLIIFCWRNICTAIQSCAYVCCHFIGWEQVERIKLCLMSHASLVQYMSYCKLLIKLIMCVSETMGKYFLYSLVKASPMIV